MQIEYSLMTNGGARLDVLLNMSVVALSGALLGVLFLFVFVFAIAGVGFLVWRLIARKKSQSAMTQPMPATEPAFTGEQSAYAPTYFSAQDATNGTHYSDAVEPSPEDQYAVYSDSMSDDEECDAEYYDSDDAYSYGPLEEDEGLSAYDEAVEPVYAADSMLHQQFAATGYSMPGDDDEEPAYQDIYEPVETYGYAQNVEHQLVAADDPIRRPVYAYEPVAAPPHQPAPIRQPAMVDPATYAEGLSWEMAPGEYGLEQTGSNWPSLKIAGAAGAALALVLVAIFGVWMTKSSANEVAVASVQTAVSESAVSVAAPSLAILAPTPTPAPALQDAAPQSSDAALTGPAQAAADNIQQPSEAQDSVDHQMAPATSAAVGDAYWTVVAVDDLGQRIESDSQFVEPWTTTGKIVRVEVIVENRGGEPLTYGGFSLADERGRVFDSAFESVFFVPEAQQCSLVSVVVPNAAMRCVELFEAAADSMQLYAQLGDMVAGSDRFEKAPLYYGRAEVAPIIPVMQEATPTIAPVVLAKVNAGANLRGGPGTQYGIVGGANAGAEVSIAAVNASGDWYQLQGGEWIAAFLVDGAPSSLPVVNE